MGKFLRRCSDPGKEMTVVEVEIAWNYEKRKERKKKEEKGTELEDNVKDEELSKLKISWIWKQK